MNADDLIKHKLFVKDSIPTASEFEHAVDDEKCRRPRRRHTNDLVKAVGSGKMQAAFYCRIRRYKGVAYNQQQISHG